MTSPPAGAESEWTAVLAKPDGDALCQIDDFTCVSTDQDPIPDYQVEVQEFIRDQVRAWAFDPHVAKWEPRLLLVLDSMSGRLIGLALHEHATLQVAGNDVQSELIVVVAVAADFQQRTDRDGRRFSDIVLSACLTDIRDREPPRRRIYGRVRKNNQRSLDMMARHGFTEILPSDEDTVLVTT